MSRLRKPDMPDNDGGDFNPFLKAENIGKVGATVVAIFTGGDVRETAGQFGEQIIIPIRIGKKEFDWAVKANSPNHRDLFDRYGDRTNKWKGQKITLTVNPPIQRGYRPYVAIERDRAGARTSKPAARKPATRNRGKK